jgi:hypothetical protein
LQVFLLHKRAGAHDERNLLYRQLAESPANFEECCRVVGVTDGEKKQLQLACGRLLAYPDDVDVVLMCTGYRYTMPFFDGQQNTI